MGKSVAPSVPLEPIHVLPLAWIQYLLPLVLDLIPPPPLGTCAYLNLWHSCLPLSEPMPFTPVLRTACPPQGLPQMAALLVTPLGSNQVGTFQVHCGCRCVYFALVFHSTCPWTCKNSVVDKRCPKYLSTVPVSLCIFVLLF